MKYTNYCEAFSANNAALTLPIPYPGLSAILTGAILA